MHVCVCVCVCVCVYVFVHVSVCACLCLCLCVVDYFEFLENLVYRLKQREIKKTGISFLNLESLLLDKIGPICMCLKHFLC